MVLLVGLKRCHAAQTIARRSRIAATSRLRVVAFLAAGGPVPNELRSGYFKSASEPNALSSMISTKPDAEKRFALPSLFASSERLKLA